MSIEVFTIECPECRSHLKATSIAATLPDQVLLAETARRNGHRQTPHPGPGRPTLARCPGCDVEWRASELREHRGACVRHRLGDLMRQGFKVRLSPKEPDPYPDFRIESTVGDYVTFQKLSSQQRLEIELGKIAEIAVDRSAQTLVIRLLGRVIWKEEARNSEWRFMPSRIGRPRVSRTVNRA
jgi:hypothetical protein